MTTKTSAPRSSIVHAVDCRPGISLHATRCGRRIGEAWAGEYTAEPTGDLSCTRCIAGEAEDQAELEASARYAVGQRVGILTGFQSVKGAHVGSYGTVTAVRAYWRDGKPSFLVRADGEVEAYVYDAWQLSEDVSGDPARAAAMASHPAGKGRKIISDAALPGEENTFPGWKVRRVQYVTPLARVIMATRVGIFGREYVVAVHYIGATEWTAGSYTASMVMADQRFRDRVATFSCRSDSLSC